MSIEYIRISFFLFFVQKDRDFVFLSVLCIVLGRLMLASFGAWFHHYFHRRPSRINVHLISVAMSRSWQSGHEFKKINFYANEYNAERVVFTHQSWVS